MQWFRHDTDASADAKLIKLRIKYGMEGYGLYWYCLELIAGDVGSNNITFELEHDAEIIAHQTGIHYERVQEMMQYMVKLNLFEQKQGVITCFKLAKRLDERWTRNAELKQVIKNVCRQSSDNLQTVATITEHNITEHNRIEKEKNKPTRFRAHVFLSEHCSNKQLVSDWLKVRKAKKSANTETAMKLFISQVEKSGLACEQVLEICCANSWAGFKAEWLQKQQTEGMSQTSKGLAVLAEMRRRANEVDSNGDYNGDGKALLLEAERMPRSRSAPENNARVDQVIKSSTWQTRC